MKLFLCLFCFSAAVAARAPAIVVPPDAARILHTDPEVVAYVCVDNQSCTVDEFAEGLEATEVLLSANPREKQAAFMVEPVRKGRQYFSAVFFKTPDGVRMVFAPDTTLSGLQVLPVIKHGYFIVRGTERESNVSWKEIDYGYDRGKKQYLPLNTRCLKYEGGKAAMTTTCKR